MQLSDQYTSIFDSVVESIVQFTYPDDMQRKQIVSLLSTLKDIGWASVDDSRYYNHPTVRAAVLVVYPTWNWSE